MELQRDEDLPIDECYESQEQGQMSRSLTRSVRARARPCYLHRTMTRQQSVATVRRIEGVLLHPTLDSRGTYRFDDDEVEALARDTESGRVTLWQVLRVAGHSEGRKSGRVSLGLSAFLAAARSLASLAR